jgi:hypothetical protein
MHEEISTDAETKEMNCNATQQHRTQREARKITAQTTRIAAPLGSLLSVLQCGALTFLPRGNLELLRRKYRPLALLHTLLQRACQGESDVLHWCLWQ